MRLQSTGLLRLLCGLGIRYKANPREPRFLRNADHFDHFAIGNRFIRAQLHFGVFAGFRRFFQALGEGRQFDGLIAMENFGRLIDHKRGEFRGSNGVGGIGAGQIELDGPGHERGGDDEDHQEHQHHIDQRCHVDLAHGLCDLRLRSRRPKLMASSGVMREQLAQVPAETFQIRLYPVDVTAKKVVRQHGGDRNGDAGCSHDVGFANRPGDSVNRDLTGI